MCPTIRRNTNRTLADRVHLKKLGARPNKTLHIGDDLIDTEAAYHAGVCSIGAGWSLNATRESTAAMQQASEITLWKTWHLLDLKKLGRLCYLGESIQLGLTPTWHIG